MTHGFRVLPSAMPPHDQPSGNYRGQEHRAVGWPPAKDPRVRTAGFLLGFMPCHMQQGLVALDARGHSEQKARATLKVKTLPLKVFTVVVFQEKQTNVPTALFVKISSHKFEC